AEYDPARGNKILGPRLTELPADAFFPTEKLAHFLLSRMGLEIGVQKSSATTADPMMCLHRHRNAFVFSGFQPEATDALRFRTELGAPVFIGGQNSVSDSTTTYSGPPAWHHVCRVFVRQSEASQISCRIIPPIQHGYTSRLLVSGLLNATVHFLPESGTTEKLEILRDPMFPYFVGDFEKPSLGKTPSGEVVTVAGVDGEVLFSW
ncbi:MAG: hypothetical protein WCO94_11010, partial [Verrucomicrobiota bacterium]